MNYLGNISTRLEGQVLGMAENLPGMQVSAELRMLWFWFLFFLNLSIMNVFNSITLLNCDCKHTFVTVAVLESVDIIVTGREQ